MLPKNYLNDDLVKFATIHFSFKEENLKIDTLKKYFNDVPKNLEKKLGELKNQLFTTEINNFINKVLAADRKD